MIRSVRMTCSARAGAITLAAAAVALLAGCGDKKNEGAAADVSGSEIVARVNGDDISAAQLNIALQKQRGMHAELGDAASKQVLDQLIDEQIIAQKALAAKLDKDPKVVQQLESVRRDILARRFIEQAADTAAKPPQEQVQKFYDARPGIFAQRKVYTIQRLDIQAPDARRADIEAHVRSLKTAAELTAWLKSQNLHFNSKQDEEAAEQITAPTLDKLMKMKDGETTQIPSQYGIAVLALVSAAPAPKTLAEASPAIEQYLSAQGRRDVIMGLQKTMRDGAKIDYQGRFAAGAASSATAGLPIATAPAIPAAIAASNAGAPASQNNSAQK
jgi:EpsD family peptidyl-prolyl cis-trans isomerase